MATTARVRVRSGEVIKISPKGQNFDDYLQPGYEIQLTDPIIVDPGRASDDDGNLRVLGYAKIWTGSEIRNATQAEIDGFAAAEAEDQKDMDVEAAGRLFETHPVFRKALAAVMDLAEDNRTGPNRSRAELITAVKARISRED